MAVAIEVGNIAHKAHLLPVGQGGDQLPGEQQPHIARVTRGSGRQAVHAIAGVQQQFHAGVGAHIGKPDGDDFAF